MAKKKTAKETVKEQLKEVWHEDNLIFVDRWELAWDKYKTVIGPFIKGTATYIWNIIYGSLYYLGYGLYNSGKVIVNYLLKLVEKM